MEASRPSPSMVVAAYAQTLIEGRKVIVFGDCTSPLPDQLLERGARLVHVYDTDLTRVAEAAARSSSREIAYAPLGQSGVAVRDGAFDVGIIENLGSHSDPAAVMKRLRRALAARGVAFVICPNGELTPTLLAEPGVSSSPPSYYELYEFVSAEFDEVRMVGQTPFVGYALADFTPGNDDEFSIDTGFVEGGAEEPEWYIAVASHFPVAVERFNVVQLPAADTLSASSEQLQAQLAEGEARIAELKGQLEAARRTKVPSDADRQLLVQVKQELEKRDAWVAQLEARAATADTRADDAEARADDAEAKSEQAQARAADAEHRHKQALQRLAELEKRSKEAETQLAAANAELSAQQQDAAVIEERDALASKLQSAERKLSKVQQLLEQREGQCRELEVDLTSARGELELLEEQLRERGHSIDELREQLRQTERLGWQLLGQLQPDEQAGELATPAPVGVPDPGLVAELRANLEELARVDARRVADLTAAQWTVAELENKLSDQAAESEAKLESLRAELQHKITLLQQYQSAQTH